MGSPCWSPLLAGPMEMGEQTAASLLAGPVTLLKEYVLQQFTAVPEILHPVEVHELEQFVKNCSLKNSLEL